MRVNKQAISNFFKPKKSSKHTDQQALVQEKAGGKRISDGKGTKATGGGAHDIELRPASPVRAQKRQEVRAALDDAKTKLTDVGLAFASGKEKQVKESMDALTAALKPLAEKVVAEADAKNGTTAAPDSAEVHAGKVSNATFDVVAVLLRNEFAKMLPSELKRLEAEVINLEVKNDPKLKAQIDVVAGLLQAAILKCQAKTIEGTGLVFDGSKQPDLGNVSLAQLHALSDMRVFADDLKDFFRVLPPQGKPYPGTRLTPSKLDDIHTLGSAADTELNSRMRKLAASATPASLNAMKRDELAKLGKTIADWLVEFPPQDFTQPHITKAYRDVQARLDAFDADAIKAVIGTVDISDLKGLKRNQLMQLKATLANQTDLPTALVDVLAKVDKEIDRRKRVARDKFVKALTAAMGSANLVEMQTKLLACAPILGSSTKTQVGLGGALNPTVISQWVKQALDQVNAQSLRDGRETLNAMFRNQDLEQQMAANTGEGKLLSQYFGLLSHHIDERLRDS